MMCVAPVEAAQHGDMQTLSCGRWCPPGSRGEPCCCQGRSGQPSQLQGPSIRPANWDPLLTCQSRVRPLCTESAKTRCCNHEDCAVRKCRWDPTRFWLFVKMNRNVPLNSSTPLRSTCQTSQGGLFRAEGTAPVMRAWTPPGQNDQLRSSTSAVLPRFNMISEFASRGFETLDQYPEMEYQWKTHPDKNNAPRGHTRSMMLLLLATC